MGARRAAALLTILLPVIGAAAPASAFVYVSQRAVGTGQLDLRIVTDDKAGQLAVQNILSWTIAMTVNGRSVTLTPDNSFLRIDGSAFQATPQGLFFDFEQGARTSVVFEEDGVERSTYNLFTFGNGEPGTERLRSGLAFAFVTDDRRSDFATIALPEIAPPLPVPEPASWAMMITGFALAGATARRERRALAS